MKVLSDEQVDGKHCHEDDEVDPVWSDREMCLLLVRIGRFCYHCIMGWKPDDLRWKNNSHECEDGTIFASESICCWGGH